MKQKRNQIAFAFFLILFLVLQTPVRAASTTDAPSVSATNDSNIFVKLAKKIVPSVVNISTLSTVKAPYAHGTPDDMFRKFFEEFFRQHGGQGMQPGNPPGGGQDDDDDGASQGPGPALPPGHAPKAMSLGSGFIIDSSGLILTNNHVVENADEIKIYFTEENDEKPVDGKVVGRDPEIDVAIIQVKTPRELVALPLGNSDALEVGEYVMAVGNPFGQGHSVTHGIISAKGRQAPDFPLARYLQTDAPINPGNSGGPLLNLNGEVIGINNAIEARAQGIGFAIPITPVKAVLPQLKSSGKVARGFIGVLVEPMTPEFAPKLGAPKDMHAPFVSNINPGSPAEKAGLQVYDVILKFDGKKIKDGDDLVAAVVATPVGNTVSIVVLRSGMEKTIPVKVSERPGSGEIAKTVGAHSKKSKKSKIDAGLEVQTVTAEIAKELGQQKPTGVVIESTTYGGPADKAGLMRGDVILEVDRKTVKDEDSFYALVKEKKSYLLRVRRMDPQGHEIYSVIILDLK